MADTTSTQGENFPANVIQFPVERSRQAVIANHLEAAACVLERSCLAAARLRELLGLPPREQGSERGGTPRARTMSFGYRMKLRDRLAVPKRLPGFSGRWKF